MSRVDGELAPVWIEQNHPENGLFRVYWKDIDENDPEWGYEGGATFDSDEGQGLRYEWNYKVGPKGRGVRDGVSKAWWPNGILKSEWHWKMGKKVGEWKRWHINGRLNSVKYFDNGWKVGIHTKWHLNGQINEERVYGYNHEGKTDRGVHGGWIMHIKYDKQTGEKKIITNIPEEHRRWPVKVKIYGAGSIGNHLSYACRSSGWEVTVYDIDENALSRMKNDIYPSRYGKWDNEIILTDNVDIIEDYYDVVIVGTPPESHIPIALEELESQNPPKILLIEKPLGTPDLKGCQELLDMSKEKDVLVLCGYNHTLTDNTIQSEKLINKGIIGDCKSLHVQWTEHWGGIFKAHPWIDGPQDCYLGFTDRGGGAMCEHSHAISIWQHFSYLLGYGKITEVSATIKEINDYDETTIISVKTAEGLVGTIIQDVITNPPIKRVRILGTNNYIQWDTDETEDRIEYSDENSIITNVTFEKSRHDDFKGEINHIFELLESGSHEYSSIFLEKGLEVMMVIKAAILSNSIGKKVFIDYSAGYSLDSLKID